MSDPQRDDDQRPPLEEEGGFFAEYWIWILAPLVLIMGALLYMVFFMGGDDSPFTYNIM